MVNPPAASPTSPSWSAAGASAAVAAASGLLSTLYGYAPSTVGLQTRALALLRTPTLYPLQSHPRPAQRARVRIARDAEGRVSLCEGERQAIERRRAHVRSHMARFMAGATSADSTLDASAAADDSLPVIALCCSGGGFRASLSALGSLRALQRAGVFDASSYIAGLSGATWAMGLIYTHDELLKKAAMVTGQASAATVPFSSSSSVDVVDLSVICQQASTRLSSNLFTGVPLDFIKAATLDAWGLSTRDTPAPSSEQPQLQRTPSSSQSTMQAATMGAATAVSAAASAAPLAAAAVVSASKLAPVSLSTVASLVGSMGLSDPFGWCIAHKLMQPLPPASSSSSNTAALPTIQQLLAAPHHAPRMSEQAALLSSPAGLTLPYPLYAGITRSAEQLEFSPHEVAHARSNTAIPTWALGRSFDKGREVRHSDQLWEEQDETYTSTTTPTPRGTPAESSLPAVVARAHLCPEPPLAYLLSCFASAHPTRIGRMLEELIYTAADSRREPLLKFVHAVMHDTLGIGHESAFQPAAVPSWLHRLDQAEGVEELAARTAHIPRSLLRAPSLTMMDAGLSFNLPFPPLLSPARGVELILALDASSPPEALRADAVRLAQEHAARNGLPFPPLADSVQVDVEHGSEQEVEQRAHQALEGVSFSSFPAASASAFSPSSASDRAVAASLARASSATVSVFPGDLACGVPTIIYMPLIASASFKPSDEYRKNTHKQPAATVGAVQPMIDPASAGPPSSASVSSHFDPRANFVSGGFCATLNFQFQPWQSGVIQDLADHNAQRSMPVMRAVLKRLHKAKQRNHSAAAEAIGSTIV